MCSEPATGGSSCEAWIRRHPSLGGWFQGGLPGGNGLGGTAPQPQHPAGRDGGQGQGGGQQGPAELVPTLAELKMLRMMQTDIKSATSAVDSARKQDDAPHDELRAEAKRIGRDQEKVKRLMEQLTDPNAGQAGGEEL